MRKSRKELKNELKRMGASFDELLVEKKKKLDNNRCISCKNDAGNNFIFIYKKNNELKGKKCISCFHLSNLK